MTAVLAVAHIETRHNDSCALERLLAPFASIDLAGIDSAALQHRVDTKYLLPAASIQALLEPLAHAYAVLEVEGVRVSPYETLYFDTPDFALYLQHHSRKPARCKVRSRRYAANGQAFMELKRKGKRDRTVKTRCQTTGLIGVLGDVPQASIISALEDPLNDLAPKVYNTFSRITLAAKDRRERVTIDVDLSYAGAGREVATPGIAVVEVKQEGIDRASPVINQLRSLGLHSTSFSKYCAGVALLYDDVKHNEFKPGLLELRRLMRGPDGS